MKVLFKVFMAIALVTLVLMPLAAYAQPQEPAGAQGAADPPQLVATPGGSAIPAGMTYDNGFFYGDYPRHEVLLFWVPDGKGPMPRPGEGHWERIDLYYPSPFTHVLGP